MQNGKKLLFALALLLIVGFAWAELLGNKGISVTSTSATTTLARNTIDLTIINDTDSANEVYVRVFQSGDTPAAATTSSPIRLEPGESVGFRCDPRTSSCPYTAFSYVCDTAEMASIRYQAQ